MNTHGWGMLCRGVDWTLCGYRKGRPLPNCMTLTYSPFGKGAAFQHTVFRDEHQTDREFWAHLLSLATEMVPAKPRKGSHVEMLCRYNTTLSPDSAAQLDQWQNLRYHLRWTMRYHPTERERLKAAVKFADMLWPQLREGTLQ